MKAGTDEASANPEVKSLVLQLHATEQRLHELLGDQAGRVLQQRRLAHPGNPTSDLGQSETERLRLTMLQSSLLDAMPAHVAVLDQDGVIVSVNDTWRDFADNGRLRQPDHGIGQNYLRICEMSEGIGSEDAHRVAAGIREIIGGHAKSFSHDYPCHSQTEKRWFRVSVTPLADAVAFGAIVLHVDITDRQLVAEDVRKRAMRLAALVEAQQELASATGDSRQLMDRAAELAQELTEADGAAFEMIDEETQEHLVYRATSGIAANYAGMRFERKSTLTGEAISRNRTLHCDDAESDPRVNTAASKKLGIRSMLVTVLSGKAGAVGALKVFGRNQNKFTEHDANSLELFADSLWTIIQRRRAEDELRIRAQQQAAIAQLGHEALQGVGLNDLMERAVTIVGQTFGVEFSSVLKARPGGAEIQVMAGFGWPRGLLDNIVVLGNETTVSGYTLMSEGPIIIRDMATDPRFQDSRLLRRDGIVSGISVVIRGEVGPWGSLGVFSKTRREFTPDDIAFVQGIANLIAEANRRHAFQEALEQQAALLDRAHQAIIVRGLDHRITFWNSGAERIYGWSREEAVGCLQDELLALHAAHYRRVHERVCDSGEWSGVIQQRRKDGTTITAQAQLTLIRDSQDVSQGIFSIATDITKQLALEEQLKQAQRLEAVGQLTGGVAHDFNNLLTIIHGNSELLVEQLADNEKLRIMADMTLTAAKRGGELTHRLLAFARLQPLEPKVIDANALLGGMEPLLRRTLSADIDLNVMQGMDLWLSLIDPSQLEGAVLNLCINARDAMPGGGRLLIETSNVRLDDDEIGNQDEAVSGDYVMIAVSDSGVGISPENLDRVFDPFFTTKDVGKGTGLGLSMVYGFVKQSRGHIKIYSQVGRGTSVKMFLPRSGQALDDIQEPVTSVADLGGSESILLIEDDELVRRHAERQLVALGYLVTTAWNGPAALDIIRRTADIDLLFTDVVMPGGMNGRALAEEALKLRPNLKVLFTSGYTENAILSEGRLDKDTLLLNKPYSRVELAQKVRAALTAPHRDAAHPDLVS